MSNNISTIYSTGGIIAKLSAGILADHGQVVKTIDKADESDFNGMNGFKAGSTIYINEPAQWTVNTGADITSNIQAVTETKVPLTVGTQTNIAIDMSSAEIATEMGLKSWAKRILEPQLITLANNIEAEVLGLMNNAVYNQVGTSNNTTFDTDTILSAGQLMDQSGCYDYSNRYVLLNSKATRSAVNARKGLFQQSTAIAEQYKEGAIGMADGFTFLRNNLQPSQTYGTDMTFAVATTVSTQGATQIAVSGLTATTGTVKKGTVFTVAGVYAVHPTTKNQYPDLQQFVVTADATADGSGNATLSVSPAMYTTGGQQNISGFPTSSDVITCAGLANQTIAQNIAFHKSAFRFCSLPLFTPNGVDLVGQETKDGITVRVVRQYDIRTDQLIMRIDVLWGLASVRPQFACRITA